MKDILKRKWRFAIDCFAKFCGGLLAGYDKASSTLLEIVYLTNVRKSEVLKVTKENFTFKKCLNFKA